MLFLHPTSDKGQARRHQTRLAFVQSIMKSSNSEPGLTDNAAPALRSIAIEVLIRSLEQSTGPITARQLRDRLTGPYKLPLETIEQILVEQVAGTKVYSYPGAGRAGKARYWTQGLEQLARESTLRLLADKSLTLSEIVRRLRVPLRGMSEEAVRRLIGQLARTGELQQWPPVLGSRTGRYSVLPPDPAFYLRDAVDKISRKLGVPAASLAVLARQLDSDKLPESFSDLPGFDGKLLERMVQVKLAAAQGAPLPLRDLWRSLKSEGWEKSTFDRTVLALAASYRITLLKHDFPGMLNPTERAELVVDQQGNHYVGIALR